jgi:hypothetical protein
VRLDADHRQVPGLLGVPARHLLERGQQVVEVRRLRRIPKHLLERLVVRMHSGRQPEHGAAEVRRYVRRAVLEALARELTNGSVGSAERRYW